MNVEQCMTREPKNCNVGDNLECPARLMWENDCGVAAVLDEAGRLLGVITDRDICMAAYLNGAPLRSISVTKAMAKKVYTCKPGDTLETAERLMSDHQIRRLPVVDEKGHLVGMLSLSDIARQLRIAGDGKSKPASGTMLAATLASTLAEISKARTRGNGVSEGGSGSVRAREEREIPRPPARQEPSGQRSAGPNR